MTYRPDGQKEGATVKHSSDDYKEGFKNGDAYQRDSHSHPWSSGAGVRGNPPSKSGNDEYNEGVKDGRDIVKKGR